MAIHAARAEFRARLTITPVLPPEGSIDEQDL
jgi:hypothetical protein